jgi:hypothetical protein
MSTSSNNKDDLVQRLASSAPEDLLAALGRLVANEAVTMDQANDVYTEARRRKIVMDARQAVLEAAERVVVHNIHAIGRKSTPESDREDAGVRSELERAVDKLIAETRRATVATWKLFVVSGDHGSPSSSR